MNPLPKTKKITNPSRLARDVAQGRVNAEHMQGPGFLSQHQKKMRQNSPKLG
jgi:hypothetical protein